MAFEELRAAIIAARRAYEEAGIDNMPATVVISIPRKSRPGTARVRFAGRRGPLGRVEDIRCVGRSYDGMGVNSVDYEIDARFDCAQLLNFLGRAEREGLGWDLRCDLIAITHAGE